MGAACRVGDPEAIEMVFVSTSRVSYCADGCKSRLGAPLASFEVLATRTRRGCTAAFAKANNGSASRWLTSMRAIGGCER